MEVKDIRNVEEKLKEEIDTIGQSPERDKLAQERSVPIIKQELEIVMLKTIENLYYLVKEHAATMFKYIKPSDLKEVETLEDYRHNFQVLKKMSAQLNETINMQISSNGSPFIYRYTRSRMDFESILQEILSFVNNAAYITQMGEIKGDSAYVRLISKTLPTMKTQLVNSRKYTMFWRSFGEDCSAVFDEVIQFFSECADLTQTFASEYLKQIKDSKKAESENNKNTIDASRVVKLQVNPQTESRLKAIKEANDKYEEFCLDFMRDLEKQYALSSKDLYENFVNVRFKKFVERYPMPIPDSASEGYAKEVINQINILISHVSKISENSYVTSVYQK